MEQKVTGLVVEVNRRTCVLLTRDGEFVEALNPGGQKPQPGEEVTLTRHQPFPWYRGLALAACLLVAIIGWMAYSTLLPSAVAYVSLDLNAGLELAVDRQGQVIEATGFNPEAENLLRQVEVKGMPVSQAIESLLDKAVEIRYIDPAEDNELLLTVEADPRAASPAVDRKAVEEAAARTIKKNNIEARLSVAPIEPELRQEAKQQGVSAGRYFLYQEARSKGKPIELKELMQKKLEDLGYRELPPERVRHLTRKPAENSGQNSPRDNPAPESKSSSRDPGTNNRRVPPTNQETQSDSRSGHDQRTGPDDDQDRNPQPDQTTGPDRDQKPQPGSDPEQKPVYQRRSLWKQFWEQV
ncbi:MAG: anti-sigma factor domain-containing protein, partial [Syntrophomonadaceae bacterium]|nr:anti-sigma factor domain-containing protein [Syntrophomonadaceae bacterium]